MSYIKKYKLEIIFFTTITLIYFFTRIYNIMSLPIFTDEAIYVRWSQIAKQDAAWRYISLTDGKQPSFVWIAMNLMKFIQDPLLASRMVSVFAGFFTLIGMFFLGREVFKNKYVGFFSSLILLFYPMALVYDRMALYDSLVGMFTVWSLYLEILLIRRIRLDVALILGMVIGGGVLTKSSAFFSIYLLPFSLILFNLDKKDRVKRFLKWVGLAIIVTALTYSCYSMLRLFPLFHIIAQKNAIFVYPFKEWIEHPMRFFIGNLAGEIDWFKIYMTWPIILLIGISLFIYKQFTREKLLILAWFVIPFVALALFGRVLYPRFIYFMTLPLIPMAALSIYKIYTLWNKKLLFTIFFLAVISVSLYKDFYVLTDFKWAAIPRSDSEQYMNGWPAGDGAKEILAFLQEQSKKTKIYVASEGTFGSLPTYIVEIYLGENKNIDKGGMWPVPKEVPKELSEKAKKMPVYMIFNQTQPKDITWNAKFIAKYQKGRSNHYMSLYQITP